MDVYEELELIDGNNDNYLEHHGILGMHWGVRRYQNADGSLTAAGQKRYNKLENYQIKKAHRAESKAAGYKKRSQDAKNAVEDLKKNGRNSATYLRWEINDREKQAAKRAYNGQTDFMYKMSDDIWRNFTADKTVEKLIKENQVLTDKYDKKAEEWMRRNEAIMNTPIDAALTTKKSINKAYKGGNSYSYGDKMVTEKHDSNITKKVKNDYNNLSDQDFMKKYSTTKDTYRKRVNKYGDPYMNSPLAKIGKSIENNEKTKKAIHKAAKTSPYYPKSR